MQKLKKKKLWLKDMIQKIESSLIDAVVHHAESLAVTMRGLDQVLPPGLIVNAAAYAAASHDAALRQ